VLLSRREKIDLLRDLERRKAAVEAAQLRVLAALDAEDRMLAAAVAGGTDAALLQRRVDKHYVREEVACALRIAAPTAAARLRLATDLLTRLPDTVAALAAGQVSAAMTRRLAETVQTLDPAAVRAVEERVLRRAAGQTFTQFARCLRRAVLLVDPRGQDQRHTAAVAERRVTYRPVEDGMGELWALLPAHHALAAHTALDRAAHQPTTPNDEGRADERSVDQRRADALVELLTGQPTGPAGVKKSTGSATGPDVQVTVALSTLLGADQQPGELTGHGPIPAELARRIAFDPTGTWRRLVTDQHGRLLDHGRSRYRPPAALADHVRARDITCRFPTCNQAARRCELDHTLAWAAGGSTDPNHLHALCPRHHHLKHEAGWHCTRRTDGTTHWTSPTGHHYRKPPEQLPTDTTARRPAEADEPESDDGYGDSSRAGPSP
jgi:hypothetical protein